MIDDVVGELKNEQLDDIKNLQHPQGVLRQRMIAMHAGQNRNLLGSSVQDIASHLCLSHCSLFRKRCPLPYPEKGTILPRKPQPLTRPDPAPTRQPLPPLTQPIRHARCVIYRLQELRAHPSTVSTAKTRASHSRPIPPERTRAVHTRRSSSPGL